jgi:hypothetical protein
MSEITKKIQEISDKIVNLQTENAELKSVIKEMFTMFIINVNNDGEPCASIDDIMKLHKKVALILTEEK